MNLYQQYTDLEKRALREFEQLVRNGCAIIGQLPIRVFGETESIIVYQIIKDEDYQVNDADSLIGNNLIKVQIMEFPSGLACEEKIVEVEPDFTQLVDLCKFISGGFSVNFKNN